MDRFKRTSQLHGYFANPIRKIDDFRGYRLRMLTASVHWLAADTHAPPTPNVDDLPKLLRASVATLAQFKIASQLPRIVAAQMQRANHKKRVDPQSLRETHMQYESMWLSAKRMIRLLNDDEMILAAASASVASPPAEAEAAEFRNASHVILSLAEGLEAKQSARDNHLIESLLLVVSGVTVVAFGLDRLDFLYDMDSSISATERQLYLQAWFILTVTLAGIVLAIRWRLPQKIFAGAVGIWQWLNSRRTQ